MSTLSPLKAMNLLVILAAGTGVLAGCQRSHVEVSLTPGDADDTPEMISVPAEALPVADPISPPVRQPRSWVETPADTPQLPRVVHASIESPAALITRVPSLVTVPAGTILAAQLDRTLSSHSSVVGEGFRALLTREIAVDGQIALPRDTVLLGRVIEAKPAKKVGGRARLALEFYSLDLPDGQQVPVRVFFADAGKSQTTKDAAIIGGSTLGGAIIGRVVDKGKGFAIGAIAGGLAGAAIANETRAKPVEIQAGTVMALEIAEPVTLDSIG